MLRLLFQKRIVPLLQLRSLLLEILEIINECLVPLLKHQVGLMVLRLPHNVLGLQFALLVLKIVNFSF